MSKIAAYYHIVFSTKHREKTIPLDMREHLYRYMWNECKKLNCYLMRIGGIEDHVHIFLDLTQNLALSKVLQTIKSHSSAWLNNDPRFPHFRGWCTGYFAASVSPNVKDQVINYIVNQERHHHGIAFEDEIRELHEKAGMKYDERDWE